MGKLMKDPILVIMAAGIGSRFGGLKQLIAIDDKNQKLIDYSLYDARRAGFHRVVFIINHQIEDEFKALIGSRREAYFDVDYAYQEVDSLTNMLSGQKADEDQVFSSAEQNSASIRTNTASSVRLADLIGKRGKPWGTAHAVACAADVIDAPFAVISANDYYSPETMRVVFDYLTRPHAAEETMASSNIWAFQPQIPGEFGRLFGKFLQVLAEADDYSRAENEFLIANAMECLKKEGEAEILPFPVETRNYNLTRQEDLEAMRAAVLSMREAGLYPAKLWQHPSIAYRFAIDEVPFSVEPYGFGHINRTYLLVSTSGKRYILQRISPAFDVTKLMHNISSVLDYLHANGYGDSTMSLVPDFDGNCYRTYKGDNYRVYDFVENTFALQLVENPEDFYQSAVAFGNFQNMLSEFPAETLTEPIPLFHNTINRYRNFHATLDEDPMGREREVQKEVDFVLDRENEAGVLLDLLDQGQLPLRVTHNDTKLNNVLFNIDTRKPVCVVDLDTVMPGLSLYDYGDAIRFGASTALEDEQDLTKVSMDLNLFRLFTRGYLQACPTLTDKEIEMMPWGAKIMTLECGMRFLADHIDGDHYFSINRPGQNLDRARTQFKLVWDMEQKWAQMEEIVAEEKKSIRG